MKVKVLFAALLLSSTAAFAQQNLSSGIDLKSLNKRFNNLYLS